METLKQIVLGVVVALIGVAVIWNLAGLYLNPYKEDDRH